MKEKESQATCSQQISRQNKQSTSSRNHPFDPQNPQVELLRIDSVDQGNLRAFASVLVGNNFCIHYCRVIQQPGQKAYVSLPQHELLDEAGKRNFRPIIQLPHWLKQAISETVLHEYGLAGFGR